MLCLSDSIRHDDPHVQRLLGTVEEAHTLPELVLAVWSLARVLALHLVESVLAERARRPTSWPRCRQCGACMRSKGFVKRQVLSLVGPLQWQRRVGRCPQGCETPQVAPLDDELGLQPHQRTSGEFQSLGCALAVFVPFATAATLLGWASGVAVSPRAVWEWVQAAGQRAMEQLHAQLQAAAEGHLPPEEPLAAEVAAMPLALGADGVMVPFRPEGGHPRGKTAWHEVKVGVLARLGRHRTGPARWLLDCISADWWPSSGISRHSRGVCGSKPCVKASGARLRWSGSVMAPGGCGACLRSASRPMLWGSWTFTMRRSSCGRGQPPGWMDARAMRVGGSDGHGTAYGMASRMGSWQTWQMPWPWRGCLRQHGTRCAPCMPTCNGIASISTMPRTKEGAAAGQRDGRECLQMAHPATLQRGRDAVE